MGGPTDVRKFEAESARRSTRVPPCVWLWSPGGGGNRRGTPPDELPDSPPTKKKSLLCFIYWGQQKKAPVYVYPPSSAPLVGW